MAMLRDWVVAWWRGFRLGLRGSNLRRDAERMGFRTYPWDTDKMLRKRIESFWSNFHVGPDKAASLVLGVPVRVVETTWEPGRVVLKARKPWWRRRRTWNRMLVEAKRAAKHVCFVGVEVEVR